MQLYLVLRIIHARYGDDMNGLPNNNLPRLSPVAILKRNHLMQLLVTQEMYHPIRLVVLIVITISVLIALEHESSIRLHKIFTSLVGSTNK